MISCGFCWSYSQGNVPFWRYLGEVNVVGCGFRNVRLSSSFAVAASRRGSLPLSLARFVLELKRGAQIPRFHRTLAARPSFSSKVGTRCPTFCPLDLSSTPTTKRTTVNHGEHSACPPFGAGHPDLHLCVFCSDCRGCWQGP